MKIKNWIEFITEEFIDNSESLVDVKMQELYDLIGSISDESGENLIYEWENKNDHQLIVNFSKDELQLRWEFDIDDLIIKKFASENLDFQREVESVDEGLDIIEKDIQMILNISEKAKAERYKGRKIPGKYLTRKKKAMKKEIDTFRGKKEYKKDWEADYDKRSGKRIKTKKSAATKAYQRMFGNK
jgi:hypothetical protein